MWDLEAGAVLFAEAAAARSAFVVLRGTIEVGRRRGERRLRLATVGPGRMLGELSLIDGGPRTATCTALEDARVLEIDDNVMRGLLDDHSAAGLGFLQGVNRALIAFPAREKPATPEPSQKRNAAWQIHTKRPRPPLASPRAAGGSGRRGRAPSVPRA